MAEQYKSVLARSLLLQHAVLTMHGSSSSYSDSSSAYVPVCYMEWGVDWLASSFTLAQPSDGYCRHFKSEAMDGGYLSVTLPFNKHINP